MNGTTIYHVCFGDDSLPYNLAELFRRIIEDTDVNPEILFEQLAYEYQMIKIERE